MSWVGCIALDGSIKRVRQDSLVLRPAVYAIIVQRGRVLLVKMRHTGKVHPPGGGIHVGERIVDALQRELREETGLEVESVRFARFEELFFYYDPSETAYHGLHFYYICRPKAFTLVDDAQVEDDAAEQPRWIEIASLHARDFQAHGDLILDLCRQVAAGQA
jgi:8-oxo-dGTP diphosphatase